MTDDAAGPWAVVLAGGEGMRLRSVTRAIVGDDRPKQYVPLISPDSLLRQTMARAARLSPRERTLVVSQQRHAGWLAADLGAHREPKLLLQPENRDTAAGIMLPAYWIAARDPDATVVVYPSDHFVLEEAAFMAHVAEVVAFVERQRHGIVLVGARAMEPDTEYGWIEPGDAVGATASGAICRVARFREKPTSAGRRHVSGPGVALEHIRHGGEGEHARVGGRRAAARASPSSDGVTPLLGTRREAWAICQGLRVPAPPELLRDRPAGRVAVSHGVGPAAAHVVGSRNPTAAVQAPPDPRDLSRLDARTPVAWRARPPGEPGERRERGLNCPARRTTDRNCPANVEKGDTR